MPSAQNSFLFTFEQLGNLSFLLLSSYRCSDLCLHFFLSFIDCDFPLDTTATQKLLSHFSLFFKGLFEKFFPHFPFLFRPQTKPPPTLLTQAQDRQFLILLFSTGTRLLIFARPYRPVGFSRASAAVFLDLLISHFNDEPLNSLSL